MWLQTYTGKAYVIANPTLDQVCLEDIARSLSHQCRFAGHCKLFYSVAEHSIHVCNRVREILEIGEAILPTPPGFGVEEWHRKILVAALLHDASEAYLLDIPRPLKIEPEMKFYREKHVATMSVILKKFGVPDMMLDIIKHADNELLATEKEQIMATPPRDWVSLPDPLPLFLRCWKSERAYSIFMEQARALGLTKGDPENQNDA